MLAVIPPVMLSPISCTTPNEPGLMFSTRRGLEELAFAFSTTEPTTAASRTTLLVMLSSALSMYVPGARTMRPTPVLASALNRPTLVLTAVCSSRRWLGTSCTEFSPGMSLALVQGSTVHKSGKGGNGGDVEVAGMASKGVEALKSAIAAWVGAVPRTKAEGLSPEGTRIAWVEAPMGVEIGVAAGVSGMAAALMGLRLDGLQARSPRW